MSAWLAWLATAPTQRCDVLVSAGSGVLAGWCSRPKRPHEDARRIDPGVLDPDGDAAWASLVWPALTALPLFDDPAVLYARRSALGGVSARAFSTLVVDGTHFAGSVWVVDSAAALGDDPFRRLGVSLSLRVPAGFFGSVPRPPGPALERYSGAPWPEDGRRPDRSASTGALDNTVPRGTVSTVAPADITAR